MRIFALHSCIFLIKAQRTKNKASALSGLEATSWLIRCCGPKINEIFINKTVHILGSKREKIHAHTYCERYRYS